MNYPYLSFIIPARNEEQSVQILYEEIFKEVRSLNKSYEIIFIDDGSVDNTIEALRKIKKNNSHVKIISLRGNFGKSVALQTGFNNASGEIIFTLDADLQDNPKQISEFLNKIETENYDLVSGWKKTRHDPWHKVIPSKFINLITRTITGVKIHDINCGFKAYKKQVVNNLNLYGELYRFIPIFAAKENYKVGEIIVDHRARKYGKSKYGWDRGLRGILDLLTVVFLTGYLRRPGHFFGGLGFGCFGVGFLIGIYITYLRLTTGSIQNRNPLLFLGMLLMIVGIQLISTGLLAEMIIYNRQKIDYTYAIKETL